MDIVKKIQSLCMQLCTEAPEPEKFNSVVDGILLVFRDELDKLTEDIEENISSPIQEGDIKIADINKNVEAVLYTNEVEEHVERLLYQQSMSPSFFISTRNELMLMAQGEDAGVIREEYYKGKEDKYFQDVLELFDKKRKK